MHKTRGGIGGPLGPSPSGEYRRGPESVPVEVADTFSFLLGSWKLERSIKDHRARQRGSFAGVGTWSLDAGPDGGLPRRARYQESGRLELGTHAARAWRQLRAELLDGGAVMLRFADGRPFVDLDLGSGTCRRVHDCGADRYEITLAVRDRGLVREHWRVRGPRKDYEALTIHTR